MPWCVRKCPYCDFNSHEKKGDLPEDAGDMTPWYVRAMIGTAAWIAALFLVLSIGIGLAETCPE